jgi:uncharacterized protein YeaO (DUF488 family)
MRIWLRRAYEAPTRNDGHRVLVDRIWPRGVSKADARIDDWARELAPSDDLRRWFDHDAERWDEFQRRYHAELQDREQALDQLARRVDEGRVTLVYGARDEHHNNAVVLRDVLEQRRAAQ